MEESIMMVVLCRIGMQILFVICSLWFGYEIGQQKVYKDLLKERMLKNTKLERRGEYE